MAVLNKKVRESILKAFLYFFYAPSLFICCLKWIGQDFPVSVHTRVILETTEQTCGKLLRLLLA